MLYLGHFSFDELDTEQEDELRHGYFTCLVDTDNADRAANEFRELIASLKKTDDMFKRLVVVYLEDIIELSYIPKTAIVTRIQSSSGHFPKSISKSLPNVVAPGINVYGWAPDMEENKTDRDTGEYKTSKPFIKF